MLKNPPPTVTPLSRPEDCPEAWEKALAAALAERDGLAAEVRELRAALHGTLTPHGAESDWR